MPQTTRLLESAISDVENDGPTDYWRVVLSAIFVQASAIAPGTTGQPVLKLFEKTALRRYIASGEALCDEVTAARNENPDAVKARMERCLSTHLGLMRAAAVVRRFY